MENLLKFLMIFSINFLDAVQMVIFIVVLMSWFPVRQNRFVYFANSIANPVLKLARKITPNFGVIDISPMVAFFGIGALRLGIYNLFQILLSNYK
jgi:YggT family protein